MSTRFLPAVLFVLALGLLAGCGGTPVSQSVQPIISTLPAEVVGGLHIVTGQEVFVPAYSEIFYGDDQNTLPLTTTLAIHNTDPEHSIIINSVRYYNTDGDLMQEFIENPVRLNPLATTGFVIGASDQQGGWGANFMVEWGAENPVYEPVIEAVMVSSRGTEGVSFISPGRVVSERTE